MALLQFSNREDNPQHNHCNSFDVISLPLIMVTTYKQDLVEISLTSEQWRTLHDLARENRLTAGEMISDWLGVTLKEIIQQAELIDALESAPDP